MKDAVKKIMVPLDVSDYCEAATLRACEVAQKHDAILTGLTILDVPGSNLKYR